MAIGTRLALVVLLTLLVSGCGPTAPNLRFSDLLAEIKADNVKEVTFDAERAVATFNNPPAGGDPAESEYAIVIPPGDEARNELLSLLDEHNVPFHVEQ